MGLDYQLRCRKCYEQLMELDGHTQWDAWDIVEPQFDLDMYKNPVNIKKLLEWIKRHSKHGKIDFIIE